MIRRILVGIGGTPFTEVAVRRSVELASAHGASITGVTVVDRDQLKKVGPVPLGGGAYSQQLAEQRIAVTEERVEEAIAEFERACTRAGVEHKVERETGNPFDLVVSHARYHDLTIFGLRSLFDYGITSEPKDALIRLVSKGVRPILAVSTRFRPVKKALIAYDGSMESAKAMRRFVQMRLWPKLTIEVVHFGSDRTEGESLLESAAEYCRSHGFPTETILSRENPGAGIQARANETEADIIVMGNSVRRVITRKVLGSTVLSTIQDADRPLLLSQ